MLELDPEIVEGILGVVVPRAEWVEFHDKYFRSLEFLQQSHNPWMLPFVCQEHSCCPMNESENSTCDWQNSAFSLFENALKYTETDGIFHAVKVIALGLDAYLTQQAIDGNDVFSYNDLLSYVKTVDYVDRHGQRVRFDKQGDLIDVMYHVVNVQRDAVSSAMKLVNIAKWTGNDNTSRLDVFPGNISWNSGTAPISSCSTACQPGYRTIYSPQDCCWDCLKCPSKSISNVTMSLACYPCGHLMYADENQAHCLPMDKRWLFLNEAFGVFIITITIFGEIWTLAIISQFRNHANNPLCADMTFKTTTLLLCMAGFVQPYIYTIQPSDVICIFRNISRHLILILHSAILLARTGTVFSFAAILKRNLGSSLSAASHVVMLMGASLGLIPLILSVVDGPPTLYYQTLSEDAVFVDCKTSHITEIATTLYPVILLILTALLAERGSEGQKVDNKFLNYTACALLLILATFMPIYYTTEMTAGKVTIMAILILIFQFAILCLTFLTKLYYMFRKYHKREGRQGAQAVVEFDNPAFIDGPEQAGAERTTGRADGENELHRRNNAVKRTTNTNIEAENVQRTVESNKAINVINESKICNVENAKIMSEYPEKRTEKDETSSIHDDSIAEDKMENEQQNHGEPGESLRFEESYNVNSASGMHVYLHMTDDYKASDVSSDQPMQSKMTVTFNLDSEEEK